jgi:hypothetical protein
MDDMKIEDQIFYFKEGVVGDVENERSIAIRIIDALTEDRDLWRKSEGECLEDNKKLQAENKRYKKALEKIMLCSMQSVSFKIAQEVLNNNI